MATVTAGKTFVSGETVTPSSLNSLGLPAVVVADDEVTTAKILNGAVTADKLATGAVTGAAGGGKLAASAVNGQTAIGTSLAATDEFIVWDASATALRKVSWSEMQQAGTVLQTLQNTNALTPTITSTIANDNTAPTSSSGTEVLSQAITPAASANKVLVKFSLWASTGTTAFPVAVLLRGSTVINVSSTYVGSTERFLLSGEFFDSPATTSSTTYSVRLGSNTGSSLYLNGDSAGRKYGGTSFATLTLQEIKG